MKKSEQRKSRRALTLLFGGVTFLILLAVILVVGALVYAAVKFDWITRLESRSAGRILATIGLGLLSLLIGAGITFFISRITMKPINNIINAMNELAAGNFGVRLQLGKFLGRHPTMREISDSFNKMAEELGRTEILRSDFVSNFSHEFKTPIVSIAGFAKLLRRGNLTQAQRQEYTAVIAEESMRLYDMATNVLNLSRVENQTILSDVTRFNLSEQLRACVLLLEEAWTKKQLDLDLRFDEVYVRGNEELLRQVWINLLDNAVKFSDFGAELGVEINEAPDATHVTITNYGQAIPPEAGDRIFQKFYQADESHAAQGNGIGLAVVQRIVELHHGSVDYSSANGKTAFTVTLPKENAEDLP